MPKTINISDTLTVIPSSYELGSNVSLYSSSYPWTNGYNNADNTSANARATITSNSTGYLYYEFDCSEIPANATITSVTANARGHVNNTSRISAATFQLYSGTTAKGSSTSFRTTTSTKYTLTPGSSWSRSDLNDLRLRINATAANSTSSRYIYFYGADVTISYTISGTAYTITTSSTSSSATVGPATQDIMSGESGTVSFDISDLSAVNVTDNGNDIKSQLVQQSNQTSILIPNGNTNNNFTLTNIDNAYTDATDGDYAQLQLAASTTGTIYFDLSDLSLPSGATISDISCSVKLQFNANSSSSGFTSSCQMYAGSTAKGSSYQWVSSGSNVAVNTYNLTIGSWTASEINNARFYITATNSARSTVRYIYVYGVSFEVTYTVPGGNTYVYTINNISADHVILVEDGQAQVIEPPEEDPTYTYYPITISSINATTNPANGTTRVVEGSNQIITITPSDPQLTLALDNGVDITSQLQGGIPNNTYTVTNTVSGASYGFNLNSSTGYYTSTNAGQANSAAVCRVNFTLESDCLVTIEYINYAESTYDYGIFGQIDTALGTTYTADNSPYLSCGTAAYNVSNTQTLTYNLTAGTRFIDIKYRKDSSQDSNNDNLQWKIASIEATGTSGDYTYTLTNIQQKHSLIFVFGNVNYYFITSSSTSGAKLFPDGQLVKLQGDSYKLTIIPDNVNSSVTVKDNGTTVTSSLQRVDGYDKNNNPIVNYIYSLTNINAAHNIVVQIGTAVIQLYVKINGTWVPYSKAYRKINGSWVEQDITGVFSTSANYVKGN